MPTIKLRLRNLETGDRTIGEHPDVDAAMTWLRARPRLTEVLGVIVDEITREDSERMRGAMRPLDEDERARSLQLDADDARADAERAEQRRWEAEALQKKAREAARTADPNRPMELIYRVDVEGLRKADPLDDRPITDDARDAVMAWVLEREEWVRDRGQTVGEAKVSVYPNAIPDRAARVVNGAFVPVTAKPRA